MIWIWYAWRPRWGLSLVPPGPILTFAPHSPGFDTLVPKGGWSQIGTTQKSLSENWSWKLTRCQLSQGLLQPWRKGLCTLEKLVLSSHSNLFYFQALYFWQGLGSQTTCSSKKMNCPLVTAIRKPQQISILPHFCAWKIRYVTKVKAQEFKFMEETTSNVNVLFRHPLFTQQNHVARLSARKFKLLLKCQLEVLISFLFSRVGNRQNNPLCGKWAINQRKLTLNFN